MPGSFLLIQLADIGDLILTTPAMVALREAYPGAHLALLTTAHAAAVIPDALADEVITVDRDLFRPRALLSPGGLVRLWHLLRHLRRGHYDTMIIFHHYTLRLGTVKFALLSYGSGIRQRIGLDNGSAYFLTHRLPDEGFGERHQAQYWLDLVGVAGASSAPRPAEVSLDRALVRDLSAPLTGLHPGYARRRIVIHPGSGGYSMARRWAPEQFAAVADALHELMRADITLVGTADDLTAEVAAAMKRPATDMGGQTTLKQLAAVLATSDLFIGADSGVMHLAAAVGTPVVAIFGPSNHQAWGPWTPEGKSTLVRSAPQCSPCSYVDHHIGLREGCAARTCMRMVTPPQVIAAAQSLLKADEFTSRPEDPSPSPPQPRNKRSSARILGIEVDRITYSEWMDQIDDWVRTGQRLHHVCTTNPEFLMIARTDPNFRHILKRADLCIADGVGLLWAAKLLGRPLPERVTGSDGVPRIAAEAAQRGWRLFFLGAAPGIADRAADILQQQHPGLQIVGTFAGSPSPDEEDAIVERVNASKADILFVAYGAPVQDAWIARNSPRLQVRMAMGVGGSFDFIAGIVPRAPAWMRQRGLEWLYRLIRQPWRAGRMLRLPRFVLAVLQEQGLNP